MGQLLTRRREKGAREGEREREGGREGRGERHMNHGGLLHAVRQSQLASSLH